MLFIFKQIFSGSHTFPCQSLLLSTNVLNDEVVNLCIAGEGSSGSEGSEGSSNSSNSSSSSNSIGLIVGLVLAAVVVITFTISVVVGIIFWRHKHG